MERIIEIKEITIEKNQNDYYDVYSVEQYPESGFYEVRYGTSNDIVFVNKQSMYAYVIGPSLDVYPYLPPPTQSKDTIVKNKDVSEEFVLKLVKILTNKFDN